MPLWANAFAGSSLNPKARCASIRPRKETGIQDSSALRLAVREAKQEELGQIKATANKMVLMASPLVK
jgi:hypothetical protein